MTPLDQAHAAMEAGGEAQRLQYYNRLAAAELFLVLAEEATSDVVRPRVLELEDEGRIALVFDLEARLAAMSDGAPVPHATLSGRGLIRLLAGEGLGLGVNLGGEGAAFLLDAAGVAWLADILDISAEEKSAQVEELLKPAGVPEPLLAALDAALATVEGQAEAAYLAQASYAGAGQGHLLAFVDPLPGAEEALTQAMGEALRLSGLEAGALDLAFFRASDPRAAVLARVGLKITLPQAPTPGAALKRDKGTPPRLR